MSSPQNTPQDPWTPDEPIDRRELRKPQPPSPATALWAIALTLFAVAIPFSLLFLSIFASNEPLKPKPPAEPARTVQKTRAPKPAKETPTDTDTQSRADVFEPYLFRSGPDGQTLAPLKLLGDDPALKDGDFQLDVDIDIPAGIGDFGEIRIFTGTDPKQLSFITLSQKTVGVVGRVQTESSKPSKYSVTQKLFPAPACVRAGSAFRVSIEKRDSALTLRFESVGKAETTPPAVSSRPPVDLSDEALAGLPPEIRKQLRQSMNQPAQPTPPVTRANETNQFSLSADGIPFNGVSAGQSENPDIRFVSARAIALDDILFIDSFKRESESAGGWTPVSGRWELMAMAFPDRSSNPFALKAVFTNDAQGGDAHQKAESLGGTAYGLGDLNAGRQEDRSRGSGFSFGSLGDKYPMISRITGDGAAARAGLLEDDIILAVNGMPLQSPFGHQLMQKLRYGTEDVAVTVLRPTEAASRTYRIRPQSYEWGTASVSTLIPPALIHSTAIILAPTNEATDASFSAAVKTNGATVGLIADYASANDYLLLSLSDALRIIRRSDGNETLLWESPPFALRYGEFCRLELRRSETYIAALIDGVEMTRFDAPKGRGRFGLFAGSQFNQPRAINAFAFFDDVRIASGRHIETLDFKPLTGDASVVSGPSAARAVFDQELDMQNWANHTTEWTADFDTGWMSNGRDWRGDQTLRVSSPFGSPFSVQVHSARGDRWRATIDRSKQTIAVFQNDVKIEDVKVDWISDAALLPDIVAACERDGSRLTISSGGLKRLTIIGQPSEPIQNPLNEPASLAPAVQGVKNWHIPGVLSVSSSQSLDYRFENAPSDWAVISGRWGIMNKWVCDPRWSWFGGRSDNGLAFISHKADLSGDVSIEFYAALMMMSQDAPYERPGDFNCVLHSDGASPGTGYALVVGGNINRFTALYRNGVEVARTTAPDAMLPSDRIRQNPKPDLHQRWFNIRLEAKDGLVRGFFESKPVIEWRDPQPLKTGRAGIWTLKNGFLISRVRLTFDSINATPPVSRKVSDFDDDRVTSVVDNDHSSAFVEPLGDANSYRVTSPNGGGTLALKFKRPTLDPAQGGVISFDYQIVPGTAIDCYLVSKRHPWHLRVRLTGSEQPAPEFFDIGRVEDADDDAVWRTAVIDARVLFNQFLDNWSRPGAHSAWGDCEIVFGNFNNDGYAVAGMTVNRAGSGYAVRNLRVEPSLFNPQGNAKPETDSPVVAGSPYGGVLFADLVRTDTVEYDLYKTEIDGLSRTDAAFAAFNHFGGQLSIDFETYRTGQLPSGLVQPLKGGSHSERGSSPEFAKLQGTRLKHSVSARGSTQLDVYSRWDGSEFGIALFDSQGVDLDSFPELELDGFAAPFETPVNLRLDISRISSYAIIYLTDRLEHTAFYYHAGTIIGEVPGVIDDDKPRDYRVNVRDLCLNYNPKLATLHAEDCQLGDFGWYGNRRGMRWSLDGARWTPAGRPDQFAAVFISELPDSPVAAVLDGTPDRDLSATPPDGNERLLFGETVADYLARRADGQTPQVEGEFYLHVRVGNEPTIHRRIILDNRPPRIKSTIPADGETSARRTIEFTIDDISRFKTEGLTVHINGEAALFDADSVNGRLFAYPSSIMIAAGAAVRVEISGLSDRLGNEYPGVFVLDYVYEPPVAKNGPIVSRIAWGISGFEQAPRTPYDAGDLWTNRIHFENTLGQTHYRFSGTRIEHILNAPVEGVDAAAFGRGFGRFVATSDGGDFGLFLQKDWFLPEQQSWLSFDYRVKPGVQLDLTFASNGERFVVPFTDGISEMTKSEDFLFPIVADGRWRKALINIRRVIDKQSTRTPPVRIAGWVALRDAGERFNRRGALIDIDNVAFAASPDFIVSYDAQSDENASVRTVRCLINDKPVVSEEELAKTKMYRKVGAGSMSRRVSFQLHINPARETYVHIQLQDDRGIWGPVSDWKIE